MAVSNNTCYEVVNISWLKSLVGSAVQNDSGQTVNVSEKSGTTYCPTYKELTNGTFIPYRSVSTDGPADDVDGITVNKKCYATGANYADNQLVNKHDVAVCNTRLKEFSMTIADASTAFDGCSGGTKNLSYTRTFTRNTWDMLSCSTQTESSHSSTDVNDTRNSLISWSTNVGSISNMVLTVGKNTPSSTGGSSSRTITVTGSSTFRHSTSTTTASTTQDGVSGEYKYWYEQAINLTNYRVTCTGSTFGCAGGDYSAAAKHDYQIETFYRWQDVCGTNYDSWYYSTSSVTKTATDYTYSKSFSDITSTGGENSDSWSKEGYEGSCSWTQSCAAPSTTYTYGTGSTSSAATCVGGSMTLDADNIPYSATTTYGDGHSETETGTITGSVTVTISECTADSGCTTSDTAAASTHGYITYTVTQSDCGPTCTCDSLTVTAGSEGASAGGNLTLGSYAGDCLTSVAVSESVDWISDIGLDGKNISGTVTANSAVDARTATIKVTAAECTEGKTFTYTQSGLGCNCTNLTVTAGSAGSAAGGNLTLGTYGGECLTSVAASESVDWISSIGLDGKNITGSVTANQTLSDRTATITVTAAECTEGKTFTYTQNARQQDPCPTITTYQSTIPSGDNPTGLPIAYWAPSSDYPLTSFTESHTGTGITSLEFISSDTLIPGQTVNIMVLKNSANPSSSSRSFKIALTTSANSSCSWTFELTQEGSCGCGAITFNGGTSEEDPT